MDKCISLLKTSIPVSSFFRLNIVPFSKEKTISDVLDKFLVELFSENICIFNNNLFTFQSIVSYFCNFELHKNQLENEYWKQNQEILGSCINWDRLLNNRLLNYLGVNKPNDSVSLSQDEIIIVDDHGDGDYTDNAIDKLLLHMAEVLGVVIFHPKSDGWTLNNCLIILGNGLHSIGIPYDGYPGLTTHKPSYFEKFIATLKEYNIFYRTLGDKGFCSDIFADKVLNDVEIRTEVEKYKDIWTEQLLKCKQNS